MPSASQAQRRFMGMVRAYQEGKLRTNPSSKLREAAESLSPRAAHDFAKTNEKGLPRHKKQASKVTSLGDRDQLNHKHVSVEELAKGQKEELEHTTERHIAKQIALDHLSKDPKYYTHLTEMEKQYKEKSANLLLNTNQASSNIHNKQYKAAMDISAIYADFEKQAVALGFSQEDAIEAFKLGYASLDKEYVTKQAHEHPTVQTAYFQGIEKAAQAYGLTFDQAIALFQTTNE